MLHLSTRTVLAKVKAHIENSQMTNKGNLKMTDDIFGAFIKAQEAAGQTNFVNSEYLPKEMYPGVKDYLIEQGAIFHEEDTKDDLFIKVTLPKGWKKVPTDHSMWSNLENAEGTIVAQIFYKAAVNCLTRSISTELLPIPSRLK